MKTCSCLNNIKIKPDEFCIQCVHKHLASAFALTDFIADENDKLMPRIAAQVCLALFHLKPKIKEYADEINACKWIIQKILSRTQQIQEWVVVLKNLTASVWKNEKFQFKEQIVELTDREDLILKLSNAIELINFEPSYELVNISLAIGQLVLATWDFKKLGMMTEMNECREIYVSLETKKPMTELLMLMRSRIWKQETVNS